MKPAAAALLLVASATSWAARAADAGQAPGVPLEYQVKAAFLLNFTRFVEWPAGSPAGPLSICVAAANPFGTVLAETVQGEQVNGRPIATRVVASQAAGCHVLFVPRGVSYEPYLRAARGRPVLTVGESAGFIGRGGIINFVLEGGKVRFEIDANAAARANLRISSRLLRLARTSALERSVHGTPAP